jgi:Xaa-Pro aminopeptidase
LKAQQATIARAKAGVGVAELEQTLHGVLREAGHGEHIFGPPIHGVGIEFEEAPLPPGHAFFHGEKAPPPLEANVVIAVGNCALYLGDFAVRVEDTVVVTEKGRGLTDIDDWCGDRGGRSHERGFDRGTAQSVKSRPTIMREFTAALSACCWPSGAPEDRQQATFKSASPSPPAWPDKGPPGPCFGVVA